VNKPHCADCKKTAEEMEQGNCLVVGVKSNVLGTPVSAPVSAICTMCWEGRR